MYSAKNQQWFGQLATLVLHIWWQRRDHFAKEKDAGADPNLLLLMQFSEMLQTRNADEWTLARLARLADEWAPARFADLADKWTLARLIDLENGRMNLQFENGREVEDGSGPSCSGVNPGEERPGPRTDLKHDGSRPSFSGVNP